MHSLLSVTAMKAQVNPFLNYYENWRKKVSKLFSYDQLVWDAQYKKIREHKNSY